MNSICSDFRALADKERIACRTGELPLVRDDDILVGDDIADGAACADDGVLRNDAVPDDGALADPHAAEQHTVLDLALNDAAVRDEGILDVRFQPEAHGRIVLRLGENRRVLDKERGALFAVEQIEVRGKIACQRVDLCVIALVLIGEDLIACAAVQKNVLAQAGAVAAHGLLDDAPQEILAHDIHIQAEIAGPGHRRVDHDIVDKAVSADAEDRRRGAG